jgi:hypothetical protein
MYPYRLRSIYIRYEEFAAVEYVPHGKFIYHEPLVKIIREMCIDMAVSILAAKSNHRRCDSVAMLPDF